MKLQDIAADLRDVEVGATVVRSMAGIEMPLKVSAVDDTYVYCGAWTFERATGFEYDPDLHWGTRWGATGSFISKVVTKP